MSLGLALQQNISGLLRMTGKTATFRRPGSTAYDPATGTNVGGTDDDEDAVIAMVNYDEDRPDGSLIERGDRKALMAAQGLSKVPQTGDQIVGFGDTVTVVAVKTIEIAGQRVAYSMQVRE